jgi:hypothetical protein
MAAEDLRACQTLWTSIDSPWLHRVDQAKLGRELDVVRQMAVICPEFAPPTRSLTESFLSTLVAVPDSEPFVGPKQAGLLAMMAGNDPGSARPDSGLRQSAPAAPARPPESPGPGPFARQTAGTSSLPR